MSYALPIKTHPCSSRIARVLRVVLGVVLVYSSVWKIERPYEFLALLYRYELVGATVAFSLAHFVPWLEFVLGVALIFGAFERGAVMLTLFLFSGFLVAQSIVLRRGQAVPCGCAGPDPDPIQWLHLVRTASLLAIGAFVFWFGFARPGTDAKGAVTSSCEQDFDSI